MADGAGAQAPATVILPGMRSGPWNSYDRAQLEDAVMIGRVAGASCVRVIRPGYATIEVDLKHEKAAGERESVQAAERSCVERTAPKKKPSSLMSSGGRAARRRGGLATRGGTLRLRCGCGGVRLGRKQEFYTRECFYSAPEWCCSHSR